MGVCVGGAGGRAGGRGVGWGGGGACLEGAEGVAVVHGEGVVGALAKLQHDAVLLRLVHLRNSN